MFNNLKDPLVLLLTALAVISYITGDLRATIVIGTMIVLGVVLRYMQEMRADNAAEKLKAMVNTSCTVLRSGESKEIPLQEVVPGDIVTLSAGDLVPADVRILFSKDLFVNQSALTGESMPVEKSAVAPSNPSVNLFEVSDLAFLGSNVESGSGNALVIETGQKTYFGSVETGLKNLLVKPFGA